ncbi:MAG: heavy metal translocating P-type ATPase, partial [Lachnospiraceae bacterium]|nr:heavy metal translocating P-type ATPase [Lachnospiraceae bacterium]
MQELVISILLTVVIIMAAIVLIFIGSHKGGLTRKQRTMMIRILITAVILLGLQFISAETFDAADSYLFPSAGRWLRFACYLIDYFIIGYDILRKAAKGIKNRQVFDESFLMAVATIGAMALAIYENGEYLEAIAVMLFYQIGEWFQGYAVGKSRRNISNLMDIRPDYANVERDGKLEKVDPDEVEIGSIIIVQPGEKVPIDGIIVEGSSSLNTSALTG